MSRKLYQAGTKLYEGYRRSSSLGDVIVTVNGKPLKHREYHSPTGFEWGYGGSGPSDLARSILADVSGHIPSPVLYHRFKRDFVAGWGSEWEISSVAIQSWLRRQSNG